MPEHSVLTDTTLAQEILAEKLTEAAEAARAQHGFAWAEARTSFSWEDIQAFGRVYPQESAPDEAGRARLEEIADRSAAIEEQIQAEDLDWDAQTALEAEWEALSDEAQALQEAYTPEDLARAGVVAHWGHGSIALTLGLVRPEDETAAATPVAGHASALSGDVEITLSTTLKEDLAVERTYALGAALCQAHPLAEDLLRFKTVMDVLGSMPCTYRVAITARATERPHAKPDEFDQSALEEIEAFKETLDLSFRDAGSRLEMFHAFRALKPSMKAKLVAYAVAQTLHPQLAKPSEQDLVALLEPEIMPNTRDHWRPTGAAFFGRIKKDGLISILKDDLGMADEAANLAAGKKNNVVEFLDRLFAEPFATLTEAQLHAVEVWAPEGMQTDGGPRVELDQDATPDALAAE